MLRYLGLSLREIAALLNTPVGPSAEPLVVTLARQQAVLCERRNGLPEQWADAGARWRALLADVQSALDREVPPDSAEGRALVARWMRLGHEFTLGDPEIAEGYRRMHEDESHWPNDETAATLRAMRPKPEHRSFFHQAVQACLRHG